MKNLKFLCFLLISFNVTVFQCYGHEIVRKYLKFLRTEISYVRVASKFPSLNCHYQTCFRRKTKVMLEKLVWRLNYFDNCSFLLFKSNSAIA